MLVDSIRFLPRSFAPLYVNADPLPDEAAPVWAPFDKRLADARIALVSSAGLYVTVTQEPFDLDRERREPTWGDPTHRVIAHDVRSSDLGMAHLHVNSGDVLADHNIALPTAVLDDLASDGVVASSTGRHVSVMGYQEAGLDAWRTETAPEIVALLRDEGADGVVLAPA